MLNSFDITAAVAALSVSGVTMYDTDQIPDQVLARDCPMFCPMPEGWVEGANAAAEEDTTFGTAATRYWQVNRTFRYMYLHNAVGVSRGVKDHYTEMVRKSELLIAALVALDVSGVDVTAVSHSPMGVYRDPSNNSFNGCTFTLSFRERINA